MPGAGPHLAIHVHLLDDRWHGRPEWPPAPFRLFQALVAAAARGDDLAEADAEALAWLEAREPPLIIAPVVVPGRGHATYVPNNDLDAVGGNPDRVGEIRVAKRIRPRLMAADARLSYIWPEAAKVMPAEHLARLESIVRHLYQLGRGVDMAFAILERLDDERLDALSAASGMELHRPQQAGQGKTLAVPARGSLQSVRERYDDFRRRLQADAKKVHFRQPRKAFSAQACYACPPERQVFTLRNSKDAATYAPWRRTGVVKLVENLRDAAAVRLREALPEQAANVERYLIGRNAGRHDKALRVRIIPLASIGHAHAGGAIRRVLVEVPQACPLQADDVFWAFAGLSPDEAIDRVTGEITEGTVLVAEGDGFVENHYLRPAVHWRTVTPAALPVARKGRLTGGERLQLERQAVTAVRQALRHAGVAAQATSVRVQREPFDRNAAMAGEYAGGRFPHDRLWHVEIVFDRPVSGPIVIGDGRYLGLGVMAPVRSAREKAENRDVVALRLAGAGVPAVKRDVLLACTRAALMQLDAELHDGKTCPLFSGHEATGPRPSRPGMHAHVFLAALADDDGQIREVLIIAPWEADGHPDAQALKKEARGHFHDVVRQLNRLYGPDLPALAVMPEPAGKEAGHTLLRAAARWENATDYIATRHYREARDGAPEVFVAEDVRRELARRHMPAPQRVEVTRVQRKEGRLHARLVLSFARPVSGPLLLGWSSHKGKGMFRPA